MLREVQDIPGAERIQGHARFVDDHTLEPDAQIAHMRRHGERVAIGRTGPNGRSEIEYFDYALAATGRAPIAIVFTDPQIGIVGGGFHAMKPGTFATGHASFEEQSRARMMLKNKGLLNVYGHFATGRFLGAEMLAPAAEHLAHLLAWSLQNEMAPAQMLDMPLYHPVVEEGMRAVLRELDLKVRAAQIDVSKAT